MLFLILLFSQSYWWEAPPARGQVAQVQAAPLWSRGWSQAGVRGLWGDAHPARGHLPLRQPQHWDGRGAQAPGEGDGGSTADKKCKILATSQHQSSGDQVWVLIWTKNKIRFAINRKMNQSQTSGHHVHYSARDRAEMNPELPSFVSSKYKWVMVWCYLLASDWLMTVSAGLWLADCPSDNELLGYQEVPREQSCSLSDFHIKLPPGLWMFVLMKCSNVMAVSRR